MQITFKRLSPDVPLPEYKTAGAVAFDLAVLEEYVLQPNETRLFRTGLVVKIPEGYGLFLLPRSSNAKKQIRLANGIGLIDQDHCGPDDDLKLVLHNFSSAPYTVTKGERIAQAVFIPVTVAEFIEVSEMIAPNRGSFGSTG